MRRTCHFYILVASVLMLIQGIQSENAKCEKWEVFEKAEDSVRKDVCKLSQRSHIYNEHVSGRYQPKQSRFETASPSRLSYERVRYMETDRKNRDTRSHQRQISTMNRIISVRNRVKPYENVRYFQQYRNQFTQRDCNVLEQYSSRTRLNAEPRRNENHQSKQMIRNASQRELNRLQISDRRINVHGDLKQNTRTTTRSNLEYDQVRVQYNQRNAKRHRASSIGNFIDNIIRKEITTQPINRKEIGKKTNRATRMRRLRQIPSYLRQRPMQSKTTARVSYNENQLVDKLRRYYERSSTANRIGDEIRHTRLLRLDNNDEMRVKDITRRNEINVLLKRDNTRNTMDHMNRIRYGKRFLPERRVIGAQKRTHNIIINRKNEEERTNTKINRRNQNPKTARHFEDNARERKTENTNIRARSLQRERQIHDNELNSIARHVQQFTPKHAVPNRRELHLPTVGSRKNYAKHRRVEHDLAMSKRRSSMRTETSNLHLNKELMGIGSEIHAGADSKQESFLDINSISVARTIFVGFAAVLGRGIWQKQI